MTNEPKPKDAEARAPLTADAQATSIAVSELGWRNGDAQAFQKQRDYLTQNAGIKGLEWVEPHEIEKARTCSIATVLWWSWTDLHRNCWGLCTTRVTAPSTRFYL